MSRRNLTGLFMVFFSTLLLVGAGLALPTLPTRAQPNATLRAGVGAVQQTAEANLLGPQQTAQVMRESLPQTLEAGALAIQQTAQSGIGLIPITLEAQLPGMQETVQAIVDDALADTGAVATSIAGTAQYVATTLNQQLGDIQATTAAISATVQAALSSLPPEVSELLGYLAEQTSVTYDSAMQMLTVTSYINEQQANDLQDIVVEAAGYNAEAVSLDTREDGTIQVTLMDVTGELPGTLVLTYTIAVVEGRITATLTAATWNGANIPLERVPADLLSAVQLGILGSAMDTAVNIPADIPFVYTVQSVNVSDAGILVVYAVTL